MEIPDLSETELQENLSNNADCACTICRLGREVRRRRAAHEAMRKSIESVALDARAGRLISMARHSGHELAVAFESAEGK